MLMHQLEPIREIWLLVVSAEIAMAFDFLVLLRNLIRAVSSRLKFMQILNGLQAAWEFDCKSLILESDSLLAVHKVSHEIHPKDPFYREVFIC